MDRNEMLLAVQEQLAIDMNCSGEELNGDKDSFVFTEVRDNLGRRQFPRREQHFEMLSIGNAIVVSATPAIIKIVKPLLDGKERDEAFSMPFVYGHSLYYLPDLSRIEPISSPCGFDYEIVEKADIPPLYQYDSYHYAMQYDVNHPRPDVLVALAKKNDLIVGLAGASADCEKMWQIGIDVLPGYRNYGIAAYLVNKLTLEILERGFIPYYGTASSNVASQRVAHRACYYPAWVCAYRGNFDEYECAPTSQDLVCLG